MIRVNGVVAMTAVWAGVISCGWAAWSLIFDPDVTLFRLKCLFLPQLTARRLRQTQPIAFIYPHIKLDSYWTNSMSPAFLLVVTSTELWICVYKNLEWRNNKYFIWITVCNHMAQCCAYFTVNINIWLQLTSWTCFVSCNSWSSKGLFLTLL